MTNQHVDECPTTTAAPTAVAAAPEKCERIEKAEALHLTRMKCRRFVQHERVLCWCGCYSFNANAFGSIFLTGRRSLSLDSAAALHITHSRARTFQLMFFKRSKFKWHQIG